MRVSAFSVRSNANGRMRLLASVSKTVRSIDQSAFSLIHKYLLKVIATALTVRTFLIAET